MSRPEYDLLSTKEWIDAPDVGVFFDIPTSAFTDTKQRISGKRWQVKNYCRETLDNVETTLFTILEVAIDKSYHTGGTIMGATVFGTLTFPQIISRMKQNYGNPGIGEIKKALIRLNNLMDQKMLIEVMFRSLEEVQIFLLESPEGKRELTEVNLIDHALIKLLETGGFYTKALENWNGRAVTDRRKWATFRRVMVG